MIVIIALLGYGLVEIPRVFWRRSFPEKRLKWHYHRQGRIQPTHCVPIWSRHGAAGLGRRRRPGVRLTLPPCTACRVGRAADKLTDSSAELERTLGIVLATSQQVSRSDPYLRKYADRLVQ